MEKSCILLYSHNTCQRINFFAFFQTHKQKKIPILTFYIHWCSPLLMASSGRTTTQYPVHYSCLSEGKAQNIVSQNLHVVISKHLPLPSNIQHVRPRCFAFNRICSSFNLVTISFTSIILPYSRILIYDTNFAIYFAIYKDETTTIHSSCQYLTLMLFSTNTL